MLCSCVSPEELYTPLSFLPLILYCILLLQCRDSRATYKVFRYRPVPFSWAGTTQLALLTTSYRTSCIVTILYRGAAYTSLYHHRSTPISWRIWPQIRSTTYVCRRSRFVERAFQLLPFKSGLWNMVPTFPCWITGKKRVHWIISIQSNLYQQSIFKPFWETDISPLLGLLSGFLCPGGLCPTPSHFISYTTTSSASSLLLLVFCRSWKTAGQWLPSLGRRQSTMKNSGHSCKTSSKQPSVGIMSRENSRGGFPLPFSRFLLSNVLLLDSSIIDTSMQGSCQRQPCCHRAAMVVQERCCVFELLVQPH